MTDRAWALCTAAIAAVMGYAAALATILGLAYPLGRLVGFALPAIVGARVAVRYPLRRAAVLLAWFAVEVALSGGVVAYALAGLVLKDPSQTLRFAMASVLFVGLLGTLATVTGASATLTVQRARARRSTVAA